MKIMIVNTLYPPYHVGGAEKSVGLLARALAEAGHNISVVTLHDRPERVDCDENGVLVSRLPMDNFYWPFQRLAKPSSLLRLLWHVRDMWNLRTGSKFGQLLDEQKPDVVNTNNISGFSPAIWRECHKRGIPIVHTLRDYSLMCTRGTLFRHGKNCVNTCADCKLTSVLKRRESANLEVVISISEHVLRAHQDRGYFGIGADQRPSAVIRNIADMRINSLSASTPPEKLVFGYIGRIEPEKGIEVLLEATTRMATKDWELIIAGDGLNSYVKGLQDKYSSPKITWLGQVKAPDFYKACDTVVVSSIWREPLSRIVIESMAYGRSIIFAESGGIPEIAMLSPRSASYRPLDCAQLAKLMDDAVASMREWKGAVDVDPTAVHQFSKEDVVKAYLDAYRLSMNRRVGADEALEMRDENCAAQ